MKMVIFKCALISYMYLLNIAYSQDETNVEESSENSTDVLLQEFNFSIPLLNMSDTNETYPSLTCYLIKEVNNTFLRVDKSRADVGDDQYSDYQEVCPTPYAFQSTINSLAGK
uniref:Secreted protein n=1 Tax=Rhodnius prolixus TaxID=13249 RepID=A0A4P6DA14_RHOPR